MFSVKKIIILILFPQENKNCLDDVHILKCRLHHNHDWAPPKGGGMPCPMSIIKEKKWKCHHKKCWPVEFSLGPGLLMANKGKILYHRWKAV